MRFLYDRPIRIEKDFDELTCIKQLVIQFGEWLMANYDSDELSVFYKKLILEVSITDTSKFFVKVQYFDYI